MRKPIIAGNWKLNKTISQAVDFVAELQLLVADATDGVEIVVAPVFTALSAVAAVLEETRIGLSAQDLYWEESGAFTGEVSAGLLRDVGCSYVIIGHSERRSILGETDNMIQKKLDKIISEGMYPILCIGETKEERDAGKTQEILSRQLSIACKNLIGNEIDTFVIAYEPVWAIGTGVTATIDMISEAHQDIRKILSDNGLNGNESSILYGGSVSDQNASELSAISDVDGFLIGNASLDANKFYSIYNQL